MAGVQVVDFASEYAKVIKYENGRRKGFSLQQQQQEKKPNSKGGGGSTRRGRGAFPGKASSSSTTTGDHAHGTPSSVGVLELRDVRREVATLGAAGLGKRQLKAWKQMDVMARIGAKAEKRPRLSAKIGKGVAKKKVEREKKAKELARETGMLTPKKGGKKVKRRK